MQHEYYPKQNLEHVVTSSPKFSFRPRAREQPVKETPGPGQYECADGKSGRYGRVRSHGFGTAARTVEHNKRVPGPGAYQQPDYGEAKTLPQASPQWRFGNQEKYHNPHARHRVTPGPGSYETHELGTLGSAKVKEKGPQWRFGTQDKTVHVPGGDKPGPGAYDVKGQACLDEQDAVHAPGASPHWSFGSEQRMTNPHGHTRMTPGPGMYETHKHCTVGNQTTRAKGPHWRFGTQDKHHVPHKHVKATPGPGAYGDTYTSFGH